jgi:hypothetical protein
MMQRVFRKRAALPPNNPTPGHPQVAAFLQIAPSQSWKRDLPNKPRFEYLVYFVACGPYHSGRIKARINPTREITGAPHPPSANPYKIGPKHFMSKLPASHAQ